MARADRDRDPRGRRERGEIRERLAGRQPAGARASNGHSRFHATAGLDIKLLDIFKTWGHHASCTCPVGSDSAPNAVLDSRFRVRGTQGLPVVDASVFPSIPGFFIVTPIYMVSEKATDVLLEDIGERRRDV